MILFDAVVEDGDGDASAREPLPPRALHVHVVPALSVVHVAQGSYVMNAAT